MTNFDIFDAFFGGNNNLNTSFKSNLSTADLEKFRDAVSKEIEERKSKGEKAARAAMIKVITDYIKNYGDIDIEIEDSCEDCECYRDCEEDVPCFINTTLSDIAELLKD